MSSSLAAKVGGVGGAIALAIVMGGRYGCLKDDNQTNRTSDTGSSDQSAGGPHGTARQFKKEELEQATHGFRSSNFISSGSFGLVYRGVLREGNLVVIKRRAGTPTQEFIKEVTNLSMISHLNLVTPLGFCQDHENGYQMLVFEYLSNGSLYSHLYDKESKTELVFKKRISIALGAAEGLCYLHKQKPPVVHGNFKTANVLVDGDFIAKVADAGLFKLLPRKKDEDAGPASAPPVNVFKDPEIGETGIFSETNDVYSFGVFLVELITGQKAVELVYGQQASQIDSFGPNESVLQWVETHQSSNYFVDHRLERRSFTEEGMKDFIGLALQCMGPARRRPKMRKVVSKLERILEKEDKLTTVMGEGSTTVITGSQLFAPSQEDEQRRRISLGLIQFD